MFEDESDERPELYKRRIGRIGKRMHRIIMSNPILRRISVSVSSMPGIGFVAAPTLIAEMPEPVLISNRKAAALAGLAPATAGKRRASAASPAEGIACGLFSARRRSRPSGRTRFRGPSRSGRGRRKTLEVFVIAVARKLVVIADPMIRNGTMRDAEANGMAPIESASVETTGETAVDEAKTGGDCKLREEGSGREAVEPMASARGGPSRSRGGKLGARSGKALDQSSGADRVPDRN